MPGDTVCIYDEASGAFNVYECPPAPAGNWCCTVEENGTAKTLTYGNNNAVSAATSFGAKVDIKECIVTHINEFGSLVSTVDIGPYFLVDHGVERNGSTV